MSVLSAVQVNSFHQDGYVLLQQMFDSEEINLLRRTAKSDRELNKRSFYHDDARLSLWNHPGNSIYGMIARCNRIVNSMEKLLDGEVYHYHSKMILKDAQAGGAWTWHQDYGYWYQNGLLFPQLASVMIAIDPATRENGCLQVLKGSHHMGRLNHVTTGEQAGADKEKVDQALKHLELIHCEMAPGDALFFHCNLLHHSSQNRSGDPRWTLICCYNSARNNPYKESHHPSYTPLDKVDDQVIKTVGMTGFEDDDSDVAWLEPDQ